MSHLRPSPLPHLYKQKSFPRTNSPSNCSVHCHYPHCSIQDAASPQNLCDHSIIRDTRNIDWRNGDIQPHHCPKRLPVSNFVTTMEIPEHEREPKDYFIDEDAFRRADRCGMIKAMSIVLIIPLLAIAITLIVFFCINPSTQSKTPSPSPNENKPGGGSGGGGGGGNEKGGGHDHGGNGGRDGRVDRTNKGGGDGGNYSRGNRPEKGVKKHNKKGKNNNKTNGNKHESSDNDSSTSSDGEKDVLTRSQKSPGISKRDSGNPTPTSNPRNSNTGSQTPNTSQKEIRKGEGLARNQRIPEPPTQKSSGQLDELRPSSS